MSGPVMAAAVSAVEPERVTPGIGGFLVFFLLGLFSWLLYRSFATHMRRVDVRARQDQEERRAAAGVQPEGGLDDAADHPSSGAARPGPGGGDLAPPGEGVEERPRDAVGENPGRSHGGEGRRGAPDPVTHPDDRHGESRGAPG